MNALPSKKKDFTKAEVADSISTVLRYLNSEESQAIPDYRSMLSRRDDLLVKIAETQAKIDYNRKMAARKTKMILWAGSGVGLAQFAFIFWGTFHAFSWDIMEPVCYLMTFGNFTAGFLFYLKM